MSRKEFLWFAAFAWFGLVALVWAMAKVEAQPDPRTGMAAAQTIRDINATKPEQKKPPRDFCDDLADLMERWCSE